MAISLPDPVPVRFSLPPGNRTGTNGSAAAPSHLRASVLNGCRTAPSALHFGVVSRGALTRYAPPRVSGTNIGFFLPRVAW